MSGLKRTGISLPAGTFAQVDSSRFTPQAAPQAESSFASATAMQAVGAPPQGVARRPQKSEPAPAAAKNGVISLGDALSKIRAITTGRMPFGERSQSLDVILDSLMYHMNQASTDVYGQCCLDLARGLVRREVPINRRMNVVQFLIGRLDPRSTPLSVALGRKIVRYFACGVSEGILPPETVNASAAVMLYQTNADHWSTKERVLCLQLFMCGIFLYGYSELLRSSVIARVFRMASDRKRPLTPEEFVSLASALSNCLWKNRVPLPQISDALKMCLTGLATKRGTIEERGTLALAVSFYMNDDFSFNAPMSQLAEVAELVGLNPVIAECIKHNIKRQPMSYYKSFAR